MSDEHDLPLYPAWRQAERVLFQRGLAHGSYIAEDELCELLGIGAPKSIADAELLRLRRLQQLEQLRTSLLENHNMMLTPVRGGGFLVVPPEQQTAVAVKKRTREMKHALRKLAREISHVDTAALTAEQRKENTDANAKLGALTTMFRKHIQALK